MLRVDPATGRSTLLFSETSPTWVNLTDNFKPLKDGSLIWSSERSGYSHLYRWNDGKWTQLTRGNWAVEDVAGVDEKAKRVYFTGTAETPIEQQLYWVTTTIRARRCGSPSAAGTTTRRWTRARRTR